MIDWYEEWIEEGIRKEVKLLRDNGSFFQEDVRDALDFAISVIREVENEC